MIAEQSTRSVLSFSADQPTLEIEMTVRMEIPITGMLAGADVSTSLLYEPKVLAHLQDRLHQALYDGVHLGLALVGAPLPQGGIAVEVTRLILVTPLPETLDNDNTIGQVAATLESLIAGTVASLWQALKTSRNTRGHLD